MCIRDRKKGSAGESVDLHWWHRRQPRKLLGHRESADNEVSVVSHFVQLVHELNLARLLPSLGRVPRLQNEEADALTNWGLAWFDPEKEM